MRPAALAGAVLLAAAALPAQTENVEADPLTCWWRTGAGGVRIGELFPVVLTCSLVETEAVRVITDESRLEPSVLQLPPFDVVGGSRAKDVVTGGRRFLQYQYSLRIIAENAFGRDVSLPPLQLTYRIENRLASGGSNVSESVQGRDLAYALPSLSVRVLSLVPDDATDIREAPITTFDEIADRAFRGTVLRVSAGIAFVAGGLVAAMAFLALARRRRAASAAPDRVLPDAVILESVGRELAAVKEESRSGWTAPLTGRALAALRIAAAYASGRPVTQTLAEAEAGAAEGQLVVNGRMRGVALISGSETPEGMARDGAVDAKLREGLARFTAARYGRDGRFDASRLDESLDDSLQIVERLAESRKPGLRDRLWMR
ncbi:MAG: hypothetical protein ACRD09_08025 [Vicinamibacterales bacterium]